MRIAGMVLAKKTYRTREMGTRLTYPGSESSYTLVAGGASASGEGNQMAEKTRIQTSFFK